MSQPVADYSNKATIVIVEIIPAIRIRPVIIIGPVDIPKAPKVALSLKDITALSVLMCIKSELYFITTKLP